MQPAPPSSAPARLCAVTAVALALGHAGRAGLPAALDALLAATGLSGAALRRTPADGGGVLASAGLLPDGPLELPVPRPGPATGPLAVLVVPAGRPELLADLCAAAAVLGLALAVGTDPEVLERDRSLLADRLHDGPLQDLLVARLAADAAVRGGSPAAARDAVQTALVGLRRLLWHVRPRTEGELPAALHALSAYLVQAGGLPLRVLGALPTAGLDPAAAAAAYRVVQAVAVGAGPSDRQVTVALRPDPSRPGAVVLDVDGGGPLADAQHWRDRLRGVGGELDDLPDAAGRIRVVLPLLPRSSCAPLALLPTAAALPTSKATS